MPFIPVETENVGNTVNLYEKLIVFLVTISDGDGNTNHITRCKCGNAQLGFLQIEKTT
jgi:hypothetical protein